MSFLSIRDVSKQFPGRRGAAPTQALLPVSLEVQREEFISVLGPSGCGKSTLLRLVAGLDIPSSGEMLLDGRRVEGPGADRGVVFQSYTLFPWLTVRDNICFGLRERGLSTAEQREICDDFVARIGLRGFEAYLPKQLSGGMQQRVAIARALANAPKVLLLDEPFGALDSQTRVQMQELLLGIWEASRTTVLFVTHDIEEALYMAERVLVFSHRPGRIKSDQPVEFPHPRDYHLKTEPAFVARKGELVEMLREKGRDAH